MSASVMRADVCAGTSRPESRFGIDIMCTGFATLDVLVTDGVRGYRAGGTAANVAAAVAWLGKRTALLARLGNDAVGHVLREDLTRTGVDVTGVDLEPNIATPMLVHRVAPDGGHHFQFSCPECRRAFARYRPQGIDEAMKHWERLRTRVFFYDRASAAAVRLAAATRRSGGLVVFEPNTAGRPSLVREAISSAHILKTSEQRASALGEPMWVPAFPQLQIVTSAEQGLRWRTGEGDVWTHSPAFDMSRTVDGAGAGDWTTAGLLAGLLIEQDARGVSSGGLSALLADRSVLTAAIRFGQALAAISVGYLGARGMSDNDKRADVLRRVSELVEVPKLSPRRVGRLRAMRHQSDGCVACFGPLPATV